MKYTLNKRLQFLGLLVSSMTVLSACAADPTSDADLFSARNDNAFDPATINVIGDRVADWQIANLENLGLG